MSDPLEARRQEWMAVVNACDLDGYADMVTPEVVWLPPSGDPLVGREAFRRWLEPFFGRFDYRFTVEPSQVRAFEGWCAELGRFRTVLTDRGGGEPMEHGGTYFLLWRRGGDGVWRIDRYVDGMTAETG